MCTRLTCPLLGVKRTWVDALQMSAFDPKRTSVVFPASTRPMLWNNCQNFGWRRQDRGQLFRLPNINFAETSS